MDKVRFRKFGKTKGNVGSRIAVKGQSPVKMRRRGSNMCEKTQRISVVRGSAEIRKSY